MFAFPVLLGDIGGTNARFGILPAPGEPIRLLRHTLTAGFPGPVEAIREAMRGYGGPAPRSAMIALANRVDSLAVHLTNAAWVVDAAAIGTTFGLGPVTLINDYPPVAASATVLDPARGDAFCLGGGDVGTGTKLVLGPGTGFGAAALVRIEDRLAIVATEAGHIELGPAGDDEMRLWPHLERVHGRITVEAVLSGPGLFGSPGAVAAMKGQPTPYAMPNDILVAARAGDPLATEILTLFAPSGPGGRRSGADLRSEGRGVHCGGHRTEDARHSAVGSLPGSIRPQGTP